MDIVGTHSSVTWIVTNWLSYAYFERDFLAHTVFAFNAFIYNFLVRAEYLSVVYYPVFKKLIEM